MNKQLIPCLYLQAEKAVTGFGQRNLFGDGNVETLAKFYGDNGADESFQNIFCRFLGEFYLTHNNFCLLSVFIHNPFHYMFISK